MHTERFGRRALAWALVVLWVLGFEIAPNLHLGLHGELAPHTHGEVAAHEDDDHHGDHGHDHDGGHHHHADHAEHADHDDHEAPTYASATQDGADDARVGTSASRLDPAHGDHDLMHRGIAVVAPPVVTPSVAHTPWIVLPRAPLFEDRLTLRAPLRPRVRGPPV